MKSMFFALSLVLFASLLVNGQTYIEDKEEVYGTWTKANSPYIILGEAIVPEGKKLTIEAGVNIQFKTGDNRNYTELDFNVGFLRVEGELNALGSPSDFIHFSRLGNEGKWGGIFITGEATFNYCWLQNQSPIYNIIKKNHIFASISIYNVRNVNIDHCLITNNYRGLVCDGGITQIINSSINQNEHSCFINPTSKLFIKNSIIYSKHNYSTHINNNYSIYIMTNTPSIYMSNSLACFSLPNSSFKIIGNDNILCQYPLFTDPENGDFSLQVNSPCIGAGENGEDIGAIPYKSPDNALTKRESKRLIAHNPTTNSSDNNPPTINFSFPLNNYRTNNQTVHVSGSTYDESGIFQVAVNNVLVPIQTDGSFEATVELHQFGDNTIVIQATDKQLNTETETLNIIRTEKEVEYKKRLALVIGNANYNEKIGNLSNPLNDARAIRDKLESMAFEVMEYENLSYRDMQIAINEYGSRLRNYDVGLVYYSGHGLSSGGENYLIPTDAILNYEETVSAECIAENLILGQLAGAKADVNIVILDACRNNPFQKSWGRGVTEAEWVSSTTPRGTFIAYATSPEEIAYDGWENHSPYTAKLLTYIDEPGVPIERVFKNVRKAVEYDFLGKRIKQLPRENTSLTGDFYFVRE